MKAATFEHTQNVQMCPVAMLRPAAVNGDIYRPVDPHDPDVRKLAATIAEHGILHPLIVTTDHVILSGHRRFCAAKLAGLKKVPVLFDEFASTDEQFVQRLVVANTSREKTLDEVLRETIICDATADQAYDELLAERSRRAKAAISNASSLIEIGQERQRSEIGAGRLPFLLAAAAGIARQSSWHAKHVAEAFSNSFTRVKELSWKHHQAVANRVTKNLHPSKNFTARHWGLSHRVREHNGVQHIEQH